MNDLIGPDIRNSILAHVLHLLLIGGVAVYGWQALSALVRKPTRVGRALRKAVYAAWLGVLFMLMTQPNPVPYLRVAGAIAVVLIALAIWDKITKPAEREELLTSGSAGEFDLDAKRYPAAVSVRRD